MKPEIKQHFIDKIDLKHSPVVRAEMNDDAVENYADAYRTKKNMPPCVLFETAQGALLVADGRHRIAGMTKAGVKLTRFEVYKGTYEDCTKFALGCNTSHGVQRTNADKRIAVRLALQTFPKISNAQIAEIAAVGDDMVAGIRKELEGIKSIPQAEKRTGRDGKNYDPSANSSHRKTTTAEPKNHENKGKPEDSKNPNPVPSRPASNGSSHQADALPVHRDETGYPIPEGILSLWQRRCEVTVLLEQLDSIKKRVSAALAEGKEKERDPIFAEVRNTILTDFANLKMQINRAVPYAVCPYCQGKLTDNCTFCSHRGFVSESLFRTISEDLKKIRAVASKK